MSPLHMLQTFHEWFFSPAGPGLRRLPAYAPLASENGLTALTLYRHNGYQAELLLGMSLQSYKVNVPKDQPVTITFLTGSLETRSPVWSGEIPPAPPYEALNGAPPSPDFIEQPHPQKDMVFLFEGGEECILNFPHQNGVLLVLSHYTSNESPSCLKHISATEPAQQAA